VKKENDYERVVEATVIKSVGKEEKQSYIFEQCQNTIDTSKLQEDVRKRLNELFPPKRLKSYKCFEDAEVFVCYSKLLKLYANGPVAALICTMYAACSVGIDVVVYVYNSQLQCYYPIR